MYKKLAGMTGTAETEAAQISEPEANPLTVIDGVRAAMPDIQAQLPAGLQGTIAYDFTEFIRLRSAKS